MKAGTLLAQAILALNAKTVETLSTENRLSEEDFKNIVKELTDDMSEHFNSEDSVTITQASFNAVLIGLVHYAIFERMSYVESGNGDKFDKLGRKKILQKVFGMMLQQVDSIDDQIIQATPQSEE